MNIKNIIISLFILIINENNNKYEYKYDFNVIWINKKLEVNEKYIFPIKEKREIENSIKIISDQNKDSEIVFWYDSKYIEKESYKNTVNLFKENNINNLKFKDIRELEIVKKNEYAFEDNISVFYRKDLVVEIMAYERGVEERKKGNNYFFVFTDLDLCNNTEISKKNIFGDKCNMKILKTFGRLMNQNNLFFNRFNKCRCESVYKDNFNTSFENGFMVIGNNNKNIIKTAKEILIDQGLNNINDENFFNKVYESISPKKGFNNLNTVGIFDAYEKFFKIFYEKEGYNEEYLNKNYHYKKINHFFDDLDYFYNNNNFVDVFESYKKYKKYKIEEKKINNIEKFGKCFARSEFFNKELRINYYYFPVINKEIKMEYLGDYIERSK